MFLVTMLTAASSSSEDTDSSLFLSVLGSVAGLKSLALISRVSSLNLENDPGRT